MIQSLVLNGGKVRLDDLDAFAAKTEFEHNTLEFLKKWFSGNEKFEILTSGSTGKPTKIFLTKDRMLKSAKATNSFFGLSKDDVLHLCLNTKYIAGQMMLVRAIASGLKVIAEEPSSKPNTLMDQPNITFSALIPMQLENLLDSGKLRLSHMKAIIVGGAPVTNKLIELLSDIDVPVYATFGMTETVSHIALRRLNGQERSDFYTVLPDVKIGVDEHDRLIIKAEVTGNEEIVTNDRVELINSTQFKWLGRVDNVVNSGGIKIQLEQVEIQIQEILDQKNLGNRFICTGLPDDRLGHKLVLIIEGEMTFPKKELLKEIKAQLPSYHAPKDIRILDKFEETPTGKVNRSKTIDLNY